MTVKDALSLLELKEGFTFTELKSKFRLFAKSHHPDKSNSVDAAQNYIAGKEAFDVLKHHLKFEKRHIKVKTHRPTIKKQEMQNGPLIHELDNALNLLILFKPLKKGITTTVEFLKKIVFLKIPGRLVLLCLGILLGPAIITGTVFCAFFYFIYYQFYTNALKAYNVHYTNTNYLLARTITLLALITLSLQSLLSFITFKYVVYLAVIPILFVSLLCLSLFFEVKRVYLGQYIYRIK